MSEALIAFSNYIIDKVSKKHQEDLQPVMGKLESIEQKLNTTTSLSAVSQEYAGTSIDGAFDYISKLDRQIQRDTELKAKALKFVGDKVSYKISECTEGAPQIGSNNTLYTFLLGINTNSNDGECDTGPVEAIPPKD